MVLNALGQKLSAALSKLNKSTTVDDETVKAILKEISAALLEADVSVSLVKQLKDTVSAAVAIEEGTAINRARLVEKAVMEQLVDMLDPGRAPFVPKKGKSNVFMFVGLQGAGKTTTVAKFAHYYQQRKWKVAMVCADTFRAGAFDQLKQNATRVRVPFYGSYTEANPVKIAEEGVAQFKRDGYEIIIVDTSGRHKQETALFEEMEQVAAAVTPDDIVFVMDSSIGQAASAQAAAFKASVPVGSVIITKLDGHAKGGGALSAVAATGSPIVFIGTGEHFDELQPFSARQFIGKMLGRGDMVGLMKEFKEKGILENMEQTMAKMSNKKEKFTLRDMREQWAQLSKVGSMSKVMEMIPGMNQLSQMMPQQAGADTTARFRRWMVLMDSMTDEELDGEVEIDQGRAIRIMKGAGHHGMEELQAMMMAFKQYEKMVGSMQKSGLLRNESMLNKQMKRDPKAVMQALQKGFNPQMLQQLGGADNLMEMMKAMGSEMGGPGGGGGGGRGARGGAGGGAGGAGAGGNPLAAMMNQMGGMGGDMGKAMKAMMKQMGGM